MNILIDNKLYVIITCLLYSFHHNCTSFTIFYEYKILVFIYIIITITLPNFMSCFKNIYIISVYFSVIALTFYGNLKKLSTTSYYRLLLFFVEQALTISEYRLVFHRSMIHSRLPFRSNK